MEVGVLYTIDGNDLGASLEREANETSSLLEHDNMCLGSARVDLCDPALKQIRM